MDAKYFQLALEQEPKDELSRADYTLPTQQGSKRLMRLALAAQKLKENDKRQGETQ